MTTLPRDTQRVGFVLLPGFSLLALASATEVLQEANTVSQRPLYEMRLFSCNGAQVNSASGIPVHVLGALDHIEGVDALMVVCDTPLPQSGYSDLLSRLKQFAQSKKIVGGLGTGVWLLARAGLLDDYRATIHWPWTALLAEQFPRLTVSANRFEIDRERLSAASATGAFDLMLAWVGQTHGAELHQALTTHFGVERTRGGRESQRVPLAARIGGGQPRLTEAVALMEANVGEPLPTEDIARLVGISRRQLERLFKQYLNTLPSRYYLELRLARARHLLNQSSQSILQVGLSCGFSSGPHFSSAYRAHFGITPREQRSQAFMHKSLSL